METDLSQPVLFQDGWKVLWDDTRCKQIPPLIHKDILLVFLAIEEASVSSPGLPVSYRGLVVSGPRNTQYYKRYAARVKVRQIKEAVFKRWKNEAAFRRDDCCEGKISIEEYEQWLNDSFPNRKRKQVWWSGQAGTGNAANSQKTTPEKLWVWKVRLHNILINPTKSRITEWKS